MKYVQLFFFLCIVFLRSFHRKTKRKRRVKNNRHLNWLQVSFGFHLLCVNVFKATKRITWTVDIGPKEICTSWKRCTKIHRITEYSEIELCVCHVYSVCVLLQCVETRSLCRTTQPDTRVYTCCLAMYRFGFVLSTLCITHVYWLVWLHHESEGRHICLCLGPYSYTQMCLYVMIIAFNARCFFSSHVFCLVDRCMCTRESMKLRLRRH